jgi:hypothetical protein
MLQDFLNAQLLPVTNEEYFGKLQKVAETLAKNLQKNKTKVLTYTLTALDPEVPADNPDIAEVRELVIKSWNTFTTNSKDSPITFIRAIMLEALKIVSSEPRTACLIWMTSRNIYKYYKLIGKENELISNFILTLGQSIENEANQNWFLSSDDKFQKLSIEIKEYTGAKIDKATLQKLFVWASGPQDENGVVPFEDPNQNWTNSAPAWSYSFAPKAATAIAQEVNKALKEQAKELITSQTQIQEAVNKLLNQIQTEILQKTSSLQTRTQLLWWKEACYSTSIKKSYRGQPDGLLQTILANDYNVFIPYNYPTSVDFFLRETHRILSKDDNVKILDFLKHIQSSSDILKTIFSEPNLEIGRISLLNFIKGLVWNKYTLEQFQDRVGIAENIDASLSDFTVWLFHDFQSLKIVTSK